MRLIIALFALASVSSGQWVETTIPLSQDTALTFVTSLVYHSPNNTIYIGADESFLVAVDAGTNVKTAEVAVGVGWHALCSAPQANKVYCANDEATITVIDGTNNQPVKTLVMQRTVTDFLYNQQENKLYCGNGNDSYVRVIDCATDSVVARVEVRPEPLALCYNPLLNRVYCACRATGDVVVIDCAADTVVRTIWVRGVGPQDICFDSASNCVYTANNVSNTVSVIDCAGDTLVRVVPVGSEPRAVLAGPPGKVYCANRNDSSVSVVSGGVVKAVTTGSSPSVLSYDPVYNKVYCSGGSDSVAVIDAARDTVVAQVRVGSGAGAFCYDPVGSKTYAACMFTDIVWAIDGESDAVVACLGFGTVGPDRLLYNPTSDRLYCSDNEMGVVFVIDGNTSAIRTGLPFGWGSIHDMVWNPFRNKVYVSSSRDSKVYVVDGVTDRFVAQVPVASGSQPMALCYNSANDKVYAASSDNPTVSVIDCAKDTVLATLALPGDGGNLVYNSVLNKVYCTGSALAVIDGTADTLSGLVDLPEYADQLCFMPPHNKLYVAADGYPYIYVVDCAGDSLIRTLETPASPAYVYYDVGNDRAYASLSASGLLQVYDARLDSLLAGVGVGPYMTPALDNGRMGDANRVYCAAGIGDVVMVVSGTTNMPMRGITVGAYPIALAWNPAHSWMYVANHNGSSISVLRDTLLVGMEEGQPQASSRKPEATVVRGVLNLGVGSRQQAGYRAELLDVSGRKVLSLKTGANDVTGLSPGVYFVREVGMGREQVGVEFRRVVIAK
jgi:YVTN family beta-propeller protein